MGVVLLLAGIGLTAAGLYLLFQRDEYASVAVVDLNHPRIDGQIDESYNPYFFLTEFETIKNHGVLKGVSATLNLNEVWGKKYNHGQRLSDSDVEMMIKKKMDLRLVNTSFMEIKVYDDDPTESATLANAIAQSYCDFQTEEWKRLTPKTGRPSETLPSFFTKILSEARPKMLPVWPNRYLAAVMTGCGILLMTGGTFCLRRSSRNPLVKITTPPAPR